ncbi:MAG: ATP-binding protein [Gemmatimonadota bacterium]|nr:ATP-binding protein [Gemmatimonadota bacterium]
MSHPTLSDADEHTRLVRICITGPECTGKTTLAHRLAAQFSGEHVPEAARLYAERANRELRVTDVELIAAEHITMADDAARRVIDRGGRALFLDTDLVSTIVYGADYYDFSSPWIEAEERRRRANLYLLCDTDVPWVSDGVRDRPQDREAMFGLFAAALAARQAHVVVVRGGWDERWQIAVTACQALLAAR